MGKRRLERVKHHVSETVESDVVKCVTRRVRDKIKTFSEDDFKRWSEYVCGDCKHLVFDRKVRSRVCGKGHLVTKEYCSDYVDDLENIRVKLPDGYLMHLRRE